MGQRFRYCARELRRASSCGVKLLTSKSCEGGTWMRLYALSRTWSLVRFKAVGMSRVVRRVGRLFACVGSLVVTAAAVVMLGASGVMLFHIAKGSEADKSRVVRTVPASFTTAVSSSIAKPAVPSVAEVGRSEQSIAEVVRSGSLPPSSLPPRWSNDASRPRHKCRQTKAKEGSRQTKAKAQVRRTQPLSLVGRRPLLSLVALSCAERLHRRAGLGSLS